MPCIDILISNDRHHCEMARPLARRLSERSSFDVRVLSLCELRGLTTPNDPLGTGAPVVQLSALRRPRAIKQKARERQADGVLVRIARELVWRVFIAENFNRALESKPDVVVMFNDAAYPYNRIGKLLRRRGIPFLLVQEGIRFRAAGRAISGAQNQGRGGATAIAAFGENSKEYFVAQGAPANRIHLTGNPRFDDMFLRDLATESARIRATLGLAQRNLLFLSNPIEFHGFCSTAQKMELVRRFVGCLNPLFEDETFRLVFKVHGQEDEQEFRAVVSQSRFVSRIVFAGATDLHALLKCVDAAVVFGTTAGLEALLLGVPVGVLEVPGVGFLHDYVSEGVALPLKWNQPMSNQVRELLKGEFTDSSVLDSYLNRTLASRTEATDRVLGVLDSLLACSNSSAPRLAT